MKDGAIVQTGTPEELVLDPATDYVAEFTRDVNRAKVMSAGALMQPVTRKAKHRGSVAASAKVASFMAEIVESGEAMAVTGADGAVLGEVRPDTVIDLLSGRGARPS
jgi:glycine betaine/proline transport system ATP-binding protein